MRGEQRVGINCAHQARAFDNHKINTVTPTTRSVGVSRRGGGGWGDSTVANEWPSPPEKRQRHRTTTRTEHTNNPLNVAHLGWQKASQRAGRWSFHRRRRLNGLSNAGTRTSPVTGPNNKTRINGGFFFQSARNDHYMNISGATW